MKINQLKTSSNKSKKRLGRGISSGFGKTAGRGTKGQKARTGSSAKPGFSGGQNPLMQQLPKLPGFKSTRIKAENITTTDLNKLKESIVDSNVLFKNKLISSPYRSIKLLNDLKLTKKVEVNLQAASKSAIDNVQQAGGTFNKVERVKRPKKDK